MIDSLKFVGVPTRDQDRALKFWTEQVGFKVATDQPFGAQRWIELRIGSTPTRLVLFTPEGHEDRIGTFFNGAFATANVEKSYEALKAKGVEFLSPPKVEPWGTYATFRDPDGNQFVLGTP